MTIVRHVLDPLSGKSFFVSPDNPATVGLDAPIGSLANIEGTGTLYAKFGTAITDWSQFAATSGFLPLTGGSLSGALVIGTDPGGSELLRVGGSVRFNGTVTAVSGAFSGVLYAGGSAPAALFSSGGDYPSVGYNVTPTGTSNVYNYRITDTASRLHFLAGGFVFQGAGVGTGGAAITWVTRATLNASGAFIMPGGPANNYTLDITGSGTTSQSYGALISAGTNSSDTTLYVRNRAGTPYFVVRGDGVITASNNLIVQNGGITVGGTSPVVALTAGSAGQLSTISVSDNVGRVAGVRSSNNTTNPQFGSFSGQDVEFVRNSIAMLTLGASNIAAFTSHITVAGGIRQTGTDVVRFENTATTVGAGASGPGLEVGGSSTPYVLAYNRSTPAHVPLALYGSTVALAPFGTTVLTATSTAVTTTVAVDTPSASGFSLSGIRVLSRGGTYTALSDASGVQALALGNASDPANYYQNGNHYFQNKAGSTGWLYINAAGVAALIPFSGTTITASSQITSPSYIDSITGGQISPNIVNGSAPSGTAPNATLWIRF